MKKSAMILALAAMLAVLPLGLRAAAQAPDNDAVETVVNDDFQKYFEENRTQTDAEGNQITGEVVVEFRVNDYGIPSAIQVTSGFSRDINREVIAMLIEGPKWPSSDGKRIRTVVEYK